MEADKCIPILVGVTAHRAIRAQDRPALIKAVKEQLLRLRALCPNSRLVLLCSLAEGGDLLCADAADELGVPLCAVLPRERADYERDFSAPALERFAYHCARAEALFVAPSSEPVPEGGATRDHQFRQAGIYVAAHSHVLLALWDGSPGTEAACGTADAVDFALNGSYFPRSGVTPRSADNEAVIHIVTPRGENTAEPAGTVHLLGNAEAVRKLLAETDEFNRGAAALPMGGSERFPETDDPCLARMDAVGRAAGRLSRLNAKQYRRLLALLAAASALLTFAFLMYDEAEQYWMILVVGVLLLAAWGCQRFAARSDCHRRYIEYRALAECLRVQSYLRYAGSARDATELLSWTQQQETAWVLAALCALTAGRMPKTQHAIRACWVEMQRDYHRAAALRSSQKLIASERTVRLALLLSVTLYLAAVGFELLCGGLIFTPRLSVGNVELCRTVLKIAVGTISAMTLFVANYYGKQSLPRTRSDHEKMARFYDKMAGRIERYGQSEELLGLLAREELTENGNWISYQRDNTPDISL